MKKGMCIAGIVLVTLLVMTGVASAETLTDDTNDVFHHKWNENLGTYSWAYSVTDKPNIDIAELSYIVESGQLTLKMKVKGMIEDSEDVWYWAYYNTTDGSSYMMVYSNGGGSCTGIPADYTDYMKMTNSTVSKSDDTISTTIDLIGTGAKAELWGWAASGYTEEEESEWWGDWAPQSYEPEIYEEGNGNGENGGNDGGGIPGFEFAFLVVAIAAVIMLKRRNNKRR